jgi:hypothetical protein
LAVAGCPPPHNIIRNEHKQPILLPPGVERIAVVAVDKLDRLKQHGIDIAVIEDQLIGDLTRRGFKAVERSALDKLLVEKGLQRSVLTEETAVDVGKWIEAQAILIVSVEQAIIHRKVTQLFTDFLKVNGEKVVTFTAETSLTGKIVDVNTTEVYWVEDRKESNVVFNDKDLGETPRHAARELGACLPSPQKAREVVTVREGT